VDFIFRYTAKIWQGGQDSNLQPTVLETATLPIELPPFGWGSTLLGFPVSFVTAAKAAVLAQLEPVGGVLFVFERVVVPALALRAGHRYHHAVLFFCHRSIREAPSAGHKENGAGPVPGSHDTTPFRPGTRAVRRVVR
jgi:hypothetical protein